MEFKNYETVFILTPVLSDAQMKDAVEKFKKILVDNGTEIINEDSWGLRKLAYPIAHKNTGFYQLFEFKAPPTFISQLETEYRRDERILRFLDERTSWPDNLRVMNSVTPWPFLRSIGQVVRGRPGQRK